ncbi:39S ribosomal protein L9, mitochondrial [Condylostylus longicornis]|uniref:39S ribosomal protein L9, mitochondrial n=1 Tax=Condylostylus longicornis TaxID=2530218 RepID=UPI00244DF4AE|nr:39S ribosomal protein L9, mitochondrial [Condylostylus longicornis]
MLRNMMNAICKVSSCKNVMIQPVRNTFVLKRRYEPLLHKKNAKPKLLKAKYFIYDLVEDTSIKKRPNVEVILKSYVDGVGKKGDIVSLKPEFAYNKLILPGLATYKTEENIKKYVLSEDEKVEELHSSPFAQRTVNMIQSLTLSIVMNKDEPWKLEPWHIRVSLRKAGYYCTDECITMPDQPIEGPDLNKEGKVFNVTITINKLEKANLKCRIHHWSTNPSEKLPYVPEFWKLDAEPLFVEEKNK